MALENGISRSVHNDNDLLSLTIHTPLDQKNVYKLVRVFIKREPSVGTILCKILSLAGLVTLRLLRILISDTILP